MSAAGVLFALLTTLSWSFCIFPFTQAARRWGANPLNHFRLLLATCFVGILSIVTAFDRFGLLFSNTMAESWIWLGLSGILGLTIGDHFAFKMYAILGPRLGSVLTTFSPAAALITGFFITGDRLSFTGIAGMFVTIAGVSWISLGRNQRQQVPFSSHGPVKMGVAFGILSAFCQGAGLVLAQKGIQAGTATGGYFPPLHATLIRLSIGTASIFFLSALRGELKNIAQPVLENRNHGLRFAVAGTIFGPTLGVALSLYTVSLLNASVAQTIFSLVPVCALFLAYFLHRERIESKAILGVLVAVAGVLILVWHEQIELCIFGH